MLVPLDKFTLPQIEDLAEPFHKLNHLLVDLYGVYYKNSDGVYIVGQNGTNLATHDDRETWQIQIRELANDIYCVHFLDASKVNAVG